LVTGVAAIHITQCEIQAGGKGGFRTEESIRVKDSHIVLKRNGAAFESKRTELLRTVIEADGTEKLTNLLTNRIGAGTDHRLLVNACKFKNLYGEILPTDCLVKDSEFLGCRMSFQAGRTICRKEEDSGILQNCKFKECLFETSPYLDAYGQRVRIKNSKLIDCLGSLPCLSMENVTATGGYLGLSTSLANIKLKGCLFSDWNYEKYKDNEALLPGLMNYQKESLIEAGGGTIIDCCFENIQADAKFLIGGNTASRQYRIENCRFLNIKTSTGLILGRERTMYKSGFFGIKPYIHTTSMRIRKSEGLQERIASRRTEVVPG
jgi:hypothetical protein